MKYSKFIFHLFLSVTVFSFPGIASVNHHTTAQQNHNFNHHQVPGKNGSEQPSNVNKSAQGNPAAASSNSASAKPNDVAPEKTANSVPTAASNASPASNTGDWTAKCIADYMEKNNIKEQPKSMVNMFHNSAYDTDRGAQDFQVYFRNQMAQVLKEKKPFNIKDGMEAVSLFVKNSAGADATPPDSLAKWMNPIALKVIKKDRAFYFLKDDVNVYGFEIRKSNTPPPAATAAQQTEAQAYHADRFSRIYCKSLLSDGITPGQSTLVEYINDIRKGHVDIRGIQGARNKMPWRGQEIILTFDFKSGKDASGNSLTAKDIPTKLKFVSSSIPPVKSMSEWSGYGECVFNGEDGSTFTFDVALPWAKKPAK